MKISYNWLQSFFKKKLPTPEKLAEILTMHSFETEVQHQTSNIKHPTLDIDVLPNRASDCLSHLGIARECSVLLNSKLQMSLRAPKGRSNPVQNCTRLRSLFRAERGIFFAPRNDKIQHLLKVEVKNKDLCPRYCACLMTEVKVGPSPKWLQERLEACGARAINNLVDVTNYVMLELGQPMHAFDADKLQKQSRTALLGQPLKAPSRAALKGLSLFSLFVRRAKKGEKIITLDEQDRELDETTLIIADTQKPIALAGIMGGANTEISEQTKTIILESANFSPLSVRRTSKKLNLRTESSMRFEYGFDPNLASQAIVRAASLIQELAGGKIAQGIIDIYPKKVKPKKIKLEIEKIKRLLGIEISKKEIIKILKSLDFQFPNSKFQILTIIVPTWRMDVSLPEDLIEEIGRLYGYEKIPAQLPRATLIPPERNESLFYENKVRDILTGIGFTEVYNYSFISERDTSNFKLQTSNLIEIENPVSREQEYLRPSLMLNLLKNVRDNLRYFDEIRLFEIGKVFQASETKRLAGIFALKDKSKEAHPVRNTISNGAQEFYELKGVIDSLLNKLRISDVWYDDYIPETWNMKHETKIYHPARKAQIKVGNDLVGWIGEISPEILEKLDIKSPVAGFEIDFEKLVKLATEERIYLPPSKYPAVVRDIAVLVEPGTKVEEVLNLIETAGGKLVQDVDLFDIYEGEEIPEGKKNLAFHIIYQADDRTLTDKEVDEVHSKIVWTLENEGEWEVRK